MADKEVWNLGGPIAASAGVRLPAATAGAAGGYLPLSSLMWRDNTGVFNASGDTFIPLAKSYTVYTSDYGFGTPDSAGLQVFAAAGDGSGIRFGGRLAGVFTERARINNLGNFGLATLNPAVRFHVKSSVETMRIETTMARGSGGAHQTWFDPTGRKGYFGYASAFNDQFYLMNDMNADMLFGANGVDRWRLAAAGAFTPVADNAYAFGGASNRPTVLWAVSGTINTSDEREKKWRGGLSKAEFAAGVRVLEELGFYQWLDAIKAKRGKGQARFHFGARAQRVWGIFAEEGLVDPISAKGPGKTPYAFLCYDKWAAEPAGPKPLKGMPGKATPAKKAGDRYGLRTDQFAMFLVAVIDMQRKADAARIDALEATIAKLLKKAGK